MKSHPQLVLVIKKDWDINLDDNLSLEELHHRLAGYINQLMVNDFSRLLNLLYRIDVNEENTRRRKILNLFKTLILLLFPYLLFLFLG